MVAFILNPVLVSLQVDLQCSEFQSRLNRTCMDYAVKVMESDSGKLTDCSDRFSLDYTYHRNQMYGWMICDTLLTGSLIKADWCSRLKTINLNLLA